MIWQDSLERMVVSVGQGMKLHEIINGHGMERGRNFITTKHPALNE
jgi:hypothetical protein